MPFEVVTIPELKNTKNLTEEQQKQAEGELILKQLQPTDTVVLLDEHGKEYRSIEFAGAETADRSQTYLCHRRPLWFLTSCLPTCQRTTQPFKDDVLPPDDTTHLHRADLSRVYYN